MATTNMLQQLWPGVPGVKNAGGAQMERVWAIMRVGTPPRGGSARPPASRDAARDGQPSFILL